MNFLWNAFDRLFRLDAIAEPNPDVIRQAQANPVIIVLIVVLAVAAVAVSVMLIRGAKRKHGEKDKRKH